MTVPPEWTAWIKQILRHNVSSIIQWHVYAQKRAKNREQTANDSTGLQHMLGLMVSSPESSPSAKAINREADAALDAAMQKLPADQRDAVRFRHLEGWSLRQLAEYFDRSEVAVAGLLKRGMKNLRQHLTPKENDSDV